MAAVATTRVSKSEVAPKVTAETMAAKQRDISVSEFFAKNRHLLGFDNPRKALLTTVKEAVDNSLDACEEAGILPEIAVIIEDLQPDRPASAKSSRYRVSVVDNGPGIVRKQVENVFGRLLFGSKFHRLKMSRGQQGIGISAAGMYGLITTGKPMIIHTKPKANAPAHHIELAMNTKTNRAEVTVDDETDDFPPKRFKTLNKDVKAVAFLAERDFPTGTSVSIELEGKYQRGRGSVDEFLELTAIANPHARFFFVPPSRESSEEVDETVEVTKKAGTPKRAGAVIATMSDDGETLLPAAPVQAAPVAAKGAALNIEIKTEEREGLTIFPRGVQELPPETKEIQPHPKGIELGTLLQMLKESPDSSLYNFLQEKFCRVSGSTAAELCKTIGVSSRAKCEDVDSHKAELLFKAFQDAKLAPPPTDCLAPIGVRQLLAGMLKGVKAEFYAASSREPDVYRGRPFQIEAAIAFGGDLPTEDAARVIRFANRVPLLFQQSACSSFKAVTETAWKNYNLSHPRGGLPQGALVVMIHMASVWVPFTSESKEAIADYDEIRKEMKLALMECGRKLGVYLRKRAMMKREAERRDVFQKYIGEISQAVSALNGIDTKKLYDALLQQAKERTAIADMQLDEDGKRMKREDPKDQEGVIVIQNAMANLAPLNDDPDSPPVAAMSKAEAARLKVAAMGKDDDEESLLDVKPVKRLVASAKGGTKETVAGTKAGKTSSASKKVEKKPAEKSAPAIASPPAKQPKPRMRLDSKTGKMVPVEDAGLF
jgi:DNA topoisomerase-6 subunit B